MSQGIGTTKITTALQQKVQQSIALENQLIIQEIALQKELSSMHPPLAGRFLAFVPDHLEFGCLEGVMVYQVSVSSLSSILVFRNNYETIKNP